jgi:photosystem II stability/assembly factor-like uncharacterized protein
MRKILLPFALCIIAGCAATTQTEVNGGGTIPDQLSTRNVLACTYTGLYNSTDIGETWRRIDTLTTTPYFYDAIYDGQYYYGASYSYGLFRFSPDLQNPGSTHLTNNLPWTESGFSLGASHGHVYFGLWSSGLYHSTDHGQSWASLFSTGSPRSIAVSGSHIVLGTDSGTFTSSDNGATWSGNNVTGSSQFLVYSGQYLYCCGRDLYRSSDHGLTWTPLNVGVPVYSFAADERYLYACTSFALMRSGDDGSTWTSISPFAQSTYYSVIIKSSNLLTCNASSTNVYRSSDHGATWQPSNISSSASTIWRLR